MNPLVIEMPDLQTIRQRYASNVITFIFWVLWFYLWLPLISLVAWVLGIDLFYDRMVVRGGYDAFVEMLPVYALIVVLIGALLIIWGVYNMQRFRGKERRTHAHPVTISTIANYFIVDPARLVEWQQAKNLVIHIDELGMIQAVEEHKLTQPDGDGVTRP